MSSLISRNADLASSSVQRDQIENPSFQLDRFSDKLRDIGEYPLQPQKIDIFQVNIGKMCNQTCRHCHVDAGPDRKEIMDQKTLQLCVDLVREHRFPKVDITGGAPEMNPHFRWFVEELKKAGAHIMNRCNLTIILAHSKYSDLPQFFKDNEVEIISSMPHYSESMTDRQRGSGVFAKSIKALQMLNEVGYGKKETGLKLNLVYNPAGCFLPDNQCSLEAEFKKRLQADFGIEFNQLFCITNMPISRYLEYLIESGNYEYYMTTLVNSFNPEAAKGVMCRNTLSIGWDGTIYDCDFNQMLDLPVEARAPQSIHEFDLTRLQNRSIVLGQHCFGCTAGAGSSCGGETA